MYFELVIRRDLFSSLTTQRNSENDCVGRVTRCRIYLGHTLKKISCIFRGFMGNATTDDRKAFTNLFSYVITFKWHYLEEADEHSNPERPNVYIAIIRRVAAAFLYVRIFTVLHLEHHLDLNISVFVHSLRRMFGRLSQAVL